MAQDWEFSKHYYHLEKERKKKRNCYNTGYSYLVTHPSRNPAKGGSVKQIGFVILFFKIKR